MDDAERTKWALDGGWHGQIVDPAPHGVYLEWALPGDSMVFRGTKAEIVRGTLDVGYYWRHPREPAAEPMLMGAAQAAHPPWVVDGKWTPFSLAAPCPGAPWEWTEDGVTIHPKEIAKLNMARQGRASYWRYNPFVTTPPMHAVPPVSFGGGGWGISSGDAVVPPGVTLKLAEPGHAYTRIRQVWHSPSGQFFALDGLGRIWLETVGGWDQVKRYPPGCDPNG